MFSNQTTRIWPRSAGRAHHWRDRQFRGAHVPHQVERKWRGWSGGRQTGKHEMSSGMINHEECSVTYNLSANNDSSVLQSLTNESAVFIQFKPITGGDSVLRRKTVLAHKQSRRGWVKSEDNSNKIIIDIQVQTRVSCKCDCVNHLVSVLQNNQPQTNSQFSFRTSFSCVVATFTHLWFLFRTKWRLREYRRSFMGSWDTEQTGRGTCYR